MNRRRATLFLIAGVMLCLLGVAVFFAATPGEVVSQEMGNTQFVGSETCADCHADEYNQHVLHGHNYKLNAVVDGQPPEYPFSEVSEPPAGYTWDDISFVIGGFAWKARFIDLEGYIITGDEDATTQYNFPLIDDRTGDVIIEAGWVPYHAGEVDRPYSCGSCHTSGYNHNPETNMYDLPGLVGQWEEEGIQCEECHGAGSNHLEDPIVFEMRVDRDSEACGACHYRGVEGVVEASGGFVKHHEQYEEITTAPHAGMDCVTCHNPHQSAVYADAEFNPNQGLRSTCTNCHFDQESWVEHDDANVSCTDCHMPPMTASGARNIDLFWADISTHLYQINVDPEAAQFNDETGGVMPYITVEYACKRCHIDNEDFQDVEDIADLAEGYHD